MQHNANVHIMRHCFTAQTTLDGPATFQTTENMHVQIKLWQPSELVGHPTLY